MWTVYKNLKNEVTFDDITYNDVIVILKHISSSHYYVFIQETDNDGRYNYIIIDEDNLIDPVAEVNTNTDPVYKKMVYLFNDKICLKKGEYSVYVAENIYGDLGEVEINIKEIIDEVESISQDLKYDLFFKYNCDWMIVK